MVSTNQNIDTHKMKFAVWEAHCGKVYSHQCYIHYCSSMMTVKDFECGHIVAQGDSFNNKLPICKTCKKSMDAMSISEYNKKLAEAGKTSAPIKKITHNDDPTESLLETKIKKKWYCCFR